MQKVVMVNPNWIKGYIDKYLVMPMKCEYITPIHHYDPHLLSHVQYMGEGDYLFHSRHYIDTGRTEEFQYFIVKGKPTVTKSLTITEKVKPYVDAIRDPLYRTLPILRGIDMSVYELFDCDIASRETFLIPVKKTDPELFDFIVDQLEFSKNVDCPIIWADAAKLPRWLNTRQRLVTRSDFDNGAEGSTVIHVSEHWVLFHQDGTVTMPELEPTKGSHVNYESKRTLKVYTEAPKPVPDDVVRAMRITICANPVGEEMKGIAWQLYKRNNSRI